MLTKRVTGTFKGHTFLVVSRWLSGLKCYHNNQLIVRNKGLFAANKPKSFVEKSVIIEDVERVLEVYIYAVTRVKIQIRVDGQKIAGDDF